jgi:predicted trehalose synthase
MTYNPTYDRTDWRAVSTRTLIEAARDSGHELAIALGERLEELEDCADELADAIAEARELDQRCDALRDELQAFYDAEADA